MHENFGVSYSPGQIKSPESEAEVDFLNLQCRIEAFLRLPSTKRLGGLGL
jgi:hypothetical protein